MNTLKTFVLMGVLTFILLLLGNAIGGQNGIFIALIMAGFMNFFSYWYSDKIVYLCMCSTVDKNTHLINW